MTDLSIEECQPAPTTTTLPRHMFDWHGYGVPRAYNTDSQDLSAEHERMHSGDETLTVLSLGQHVHRKENEK